MRISKTGLFFSATLAAFAAGCAREKAAAPAGQPGGQISSPAASSGLAFAPDIPDRLRKLARTPIDYDHALLDAKETQVVAKLIEASRYLNNIFLSQVWEGNPALRGQIAAAAGKGDSTARWALALFDVHKGPWDRLKQNEPFVGKDPKPPGAGFYPTDMTKEEFEKWVAAHPQDKAAFEGLFTVIRRQGQSLVAIPYSKAYGPILQPAAQALRQAAALTGNASLRDYLNKRADAFLSDDYYASDIAWMDLDSDIEVVIGPYEVYEDALFNYKAAFESFVTVRDRKESEKLAVYAKHLPDMERNLPIPEAHKNLRRKFESPIRVVQEIYTAADARSGVQTSAFNLPNDERVREAKGSKKVLLKNVMDAKFQQSGRPIAERILVAGELPNLSFDAYFDHTLFHELSHGIGPGLITGPDGKRVDSRLLLKEIYSTLEECKADVTGLWNILLALDRGWLTGISEAQLFSTYNGLMFRGMRFGIDEAHGQGTAIQWNWFREKGAISPAPEGRFQTDVPKFREAVRSLANELLEIEATGDYARGKALLGKYGRSTPEVEATIAKLSDIPVDIAPVFVAAGER
ncbi:MAG TPA: peptidase [Thermoanaerobaculia bacterium]|nr:peptidase [Thermoanaerobaculia bacterium]